MPFSRVHDFDMFKNNQSLRDCVMSILSSLFVYTVTQPLKTDYYFSSSVCHYRTIFWPYRMSFKLFVPRFQILNSEDIKVRLQHTIKMLYGTQLSEFL